MQCTRGSRRPGGATAQTLPGRAVSTSRRKTRQRSSGPSLRLSASRKQCVEGWQQVTGQALLCKNRIGAGTLGLLTKFVR